MEVITLEAAATSGAKVYFTGIPCQKGHVSERRVGNRTCVTCHREGTAQWKKDNPEKAKQHRKDWKKGPSARVGRSRHKRTLRLKRYGLTREQVDAMMLEQGGTCGACGADISKRYAIDHCHRSGKVRGLLCNHCNLALGFARDSIDTLNALISYLARH